MANPSIVISKTKLSNLAKLKQKKYRNSEKRLILEGPRLMQQLAQYQVFPLELYYTVWQDFLSSFTCPLYQVQERDMLRFTDTDSPPQIAGLYPLPTARQEAFHCALYLDGVRDPGNMGTIFRLAAAFDIQQILLSPDCCEVNNPKVIRASLGAVYQLPFTVVAYEDLFKMPAAKISLDMQGATPLKEFCPPEKPAIYILGSEANGIGDELLNASDLRLKIEMAEGMESLNVAVACGILCHYLYVNKCFISNP
ncbi:MAG: RNA methyltransferase [Candidatus Cloacimonadaceae bacterium]